MNRDPVAVIGLGRFGSAVALQLSDDGVEVLGIDRDQSQVALIADSLHITFEGDGTRVDLLRQVGVSATDYPRAVVALGGDVGASALAVTALQEIGIGDITVQAESEQHRTIMRRLGATKVVFPANEAGARTAYELTGKTRRVALDVGSGALAILPAPKNMRGKALGEANEFTKDGCLVLGVVRGAMELPIDATPEVKIGPEDRLIVSGPVERLETWV